MREALFRGKRLDNGEWVEGDLEHNAQGEEYIRCWYCGAYQSYKIVPDTRGEYIGMTDINGAKIFEGDITYFVDIDGAQRIFVAVWDEEELDFKVTNGKKNYGAGGFQYFPCCKDVKIIGNIHDNLDLLGKLGTTLRSDI